ncbi:hypothetical protein FACS1894219_01160 [Clostridia bacterium]|nr:hypothetical protein FACS1894219_01160 [Clostridia bacterium]
MSTDGFEPSHRDREHHDHHDNHHDHNHAHSELSAATINLIGSGNELAKSVAPKALIAILDKENNHKVEEFLHTKHVHFHFLVSGMGTANNEFLKAFGLSGTEKIAMIAVESAARVENLLAALVERFSLSTPGHGIAFIVPVSGISAAISQAFDRSALLAHVKNRVVERFNEQMEKSEKEFAQKPDDERYELVVSVINQGYSENLMTAARAAGARGGTIINARRTGFDEDLKFFGIQVQSEKELVMIVCKRSQKKELMQAITKNCGIKSEARGIVISLPVESCAGIDFRAETDDGEADASVKGKAGGLS